MVREYTPADRESFESFVSGHENGSFMQSSFWPLIKTEWESVILICEENGEIRGTLSLLIRRMPVPVLNITVAYAPRGPVCDYGDTAVMKELFDAARAVARKHGACVVKADPDRTADDEKLLSAARLLGMKITCHGVGYENMQPICNHKIDLTAVGGGDADALMTYLPSKTRNLVRTGQKRGAELFFGTENDIPAFWEIVKETEARKGISLRSEEYFRRMLEAIPEKNRLFILARAEGRVIAGGLFILYGKTLTYSYGAMASGGGHFNASHLIQFEIMKYGAANGYTVYDMGGVDGNNPKDGVAVFKANFGGRVIKNIGELDLAVKPFKNAVFNFSLGTGRKLLKVFKRK